MQRSKRLTPYLLKLDDDTWHQINENRMSMSRLFPEGVSKKQYIMNAIVSYGKSFEEHARPKLDLLHEIEIEEPLGVWYENGLEERYEKF